MTVVCWLLCGIGNFFLSRALMKAKGTKQSTGRNVLDLLLCIVSGPVANIILGGVASAMFGVSMLFRAASGFAKADHLVE